MQHTESYGTKNFLGKRGSYITSAGIHEEWTKKLAAHHGCEQPRTLATGSEKADAMNFVGLDVPGSIR
jgi:hypothetical protein